MKETRRIPATEKSSDKIRVLWLANIPSPYRVDFFNELGRCCSLTVLFERRASSERDESWKAYRMDHFHGIFLRGTALGTAEAFCPGILRHIRKQYDYIVVTNYSDPTGLLAITYMKARGISYLIEGDGAFPGKGREYREKLKRWAISGAAACFSTGSRHDAYYRQYGAKKILRYPFSSVKAADLLDFPVSFKEKVQLRSALGIPEKQMVLAVGQLIPRKGYDILIQAAETINRDVGFYIIGGSPGQIAQKEKEYASPAHVHFIPFQKWEKLRQYYLAADLLVHPCREDIWGLVVNEALACGLPVVSTNHCNAALELIQEGINGCLVPPENSAALAEAIRRCLCLDTEKEQESTENTKRAGQKTLIMEMAEAALGSVRDYTVESMAKRHIEVFSDGLG